MLGLCDSRESEDMEVNPVDNEIEADHHEHPYDRCPWKVLARIHDFSEFTPREFLSTGDRVFVLGHYASTMRKNGRKAASDWVHIFTVRGGKLAAFLEFTDTAEFARAWTD